jgi:hypothetical protein
VIFVTIDGKLGVAPREVQEGDILCFITGALKPCIFRKKTVGYWNIISRRCSIFDFNKDHFRRCRTDDINEFESLLKKFLSLWRSFIFINNKSRGRRSVFPLDDYAQLHSNTVIK